MRSFIVMAMFTASLAHAGWLEYQEERNLELDAAGIDAFAIRAGAGSLSIKGVEGADSITVTATIQVDEDDADKAREIIANKLELTLERQGDTAVLRSLFEGGSWSANSNGAVALEIEMPTGVSVRVEDSSGSIDIRDIDADLRIDDSSGSIKVSGVGALDIDDGSGSIDVFGASGDVAIVDGSGSIRVREVGGSVTIDDGSGSIDIRDVENDVIIEDDGSGGLSVSDVRGTVDQGG